MTTSPARRKLVNPADAGRRRRAYGRPRPAKHEEVGMYVVVQHEFQDPETALTRGVKLIKNEGAPAGVRGLQFYPSTDRSAATCLWEADSVEAIQEYVDSTLGDSSVNKCYEVDAEQAFAERPLGLPASPAIRA
jgi:hypothetical protein